jgi:hypothetical protein
MKETAKRNDKFVTIVKSAFRDAFLDAYCPDGADPLARDNDSEYKLKNSTIASYFFGLPNRDLGSSTAWNLIYNFIGWQDNVTTATKIINAVLMPVTIILNILALPFKSLKSIAKLFTEVLPAALANICKLYSKNLKNRSKVLASEDYSEQAMVMLLTPIRMILNGMFYIFSTLKFIGRAATSPITSIKIAWSGNPDHGKFLSAIKVALSMIATLSIYVILFPLAAKFIAAEAIPFVASYLPVAIANVISMVSQAVAPVLAVIANATIIPMVESIVIGVLNALALPTNMPSIISTIFATPAITGLGAFAAVFITTFGTGISKLTDKLGNRWHKSTEIIEPNPEPPVSNIPISNPQDEVQIYPVYSSPLHNQPQQPPPITSSTPPTLLPFN